MYFSLLQYVALSAVIINLMCAGLLMVLLIFVPFVRKRKLQNKYAWCILCSVPALFLLPLLRGYGEAAFTFYHSHMLLNMVPLTTVLAVRHYGRHYYTSPLPFFCDSWPVWLACTLWGVVAVLAGRGIFGFGDSLPLSAAIVSFAVGCGAMTGVLHVRHYGKLRCAATVHGAETIGGESCENYEKRLFLKTVMAGETVLAIALLVHWAGRSETTFITAVTVFTMYNVLITVLILVNDSTAGDARLQYEDIQRWLEGEIAEREAYYSKECKELSRRIEALEAGRPTAAGEGRGWEEAPDGHPRRRVKRPGARTLTVNTVESQILDILNAWIEARGYCRRNLNLDGLAARMGTNRSYLSRCINVHWGMGFSNFLSSLRVREACRLMADDMQLPMTSVAYRCGFNDGASFARCFKQVLHITPSMWKQLCTDPEIRRRTEALGKMKIMEGDSSVGTDDGPLGKLETPDAPAGPQIPEGSAGSEYAEKHENDGAADSMSSSEG